jgi:proteasome assembly chaperone 2
MVQFIKVPSSEEDVAIHFSQTTLITSIPSVGNVGQLALDLLIRNIPNTIRVGYIQSPYVLPMVGNDAFGESEEGRLHLAAEVYVMLDYNYTLLHIRSPIVKHKLFAKELVSWVKREGFIRWLILASANASWRMDQLLSEVQQSNNTQISVRCKIAGGNEWKNSELVKVVPPLDDLAPQHHSSSVHSEEEEKFLTGLKRELITAAENEHVSTCLILVLCNEGDNLPHGTFLAEIVSTYVLFAGDVEKARSLKWTMPSSWKFLYGPPPSSSLY